MSQVHGVSLPPRTEAAASRKGKGASTASFKECLRESLGREVRLSKHASDRLGSRRITLDASRREKLADAVRKVGEKGARDSLIVLDDICFIVSVRKGVVVTAMNSEDGAERIFTNIDSAYIVD